MEKPEKFPPPSSRKTQVLVGWFLLILLSLSPLYVYKSQWNPSDLWLSKDRRILSRLQSNLSPYGPRPGSTPQKNSNPSQVYTLLKLREQGRLYLEIYYAPSEVGPQGRIDRVDLLDPFDARVEINGRFMNLALINLSAEGSDRKSSTTGERFQILAPTTDSNFTAKLNVFEFDEDKGKLIRTSTF